MIRIGVISDTHDYFDPSLPEHFQGVEHIIHCGDVGTETILQKLNEIAPTTAVSGNTDWNENLKENELLHLAGRLIFIRHIIDSINPRHPHRQLVDKHKPNWVVYGHTHLWTTDVVDGIHFLNPGYSGCYNRSCARSVAIIAFESDSHQLKFIDLDS